MIGRDQQAILICGTITYPFNGFSGKRFIHRKTGDDTLLYRPLCVNAVSGKDYISAVSAGDLNAEMSVGVSGCIHQQNAAVVKHIIGLPDRADASVLVLKRLYIHALPACFHIAEEIAVCIAQFFPCGGKPLCAFYQWDAAGMVEIHVAEINAVYILRADSQGLELAVGNVSFLSFSRKKPVTARGLLS